MIFLHSAGIQEAKLLIIAIDDKERITELAHYATKNYPHAHVIARAVDRTHVYDLYAAGCRDIIRETYDSSIRMGRSALEALGDERDAAQAKVDEYVADDQQFLIQMAGLYKPNVSLADNQEFVDGVKKLIAERDQRVAEKLNRRLQTPDEDIVTNSAVEG